MAVERLWRQTALGLFVPSGETNMNHEKLIELVRDYTFLYDLSDRRYSDNQRKDNAWKEIAKQLQVQRK